MAVVPLVTKVGGAVTGGPVASVTGPGVMGLVVARVGSVVITGGSAKRKHEIDI